MPVNVTLQVPAEVGPVRLILSDFTGSTIAPTRDATFKNTETVELKPLFPPVSRPGSYLLFAVPASKGPLATPSEFIGTPIFIDVRVDHRVGAPSGPMITRIDPLRYADIDTSAGPMTAAFYYDSAPITIENFLRLGEGGFYDGLTFHTIVPGFTIQTGDPKGDGTGGPGYTVDAEFNNRKHEPGVMSMSRLRDPLEDPTTAIAPRAEFANSAGSQFFICLDYKHTQQYDRVYTAFGKIVSGMEAVNKIAATPLADANLGRPTNPPTITKITIHNVDPQHNPYLSIVNFGARREPSVPTRD
jgi:cyclophilin family peptidyl-prolyl cis-trans isomerase